MTSRQKNTRVLQKNLKKYKHQNALQDCRSGNNLLVIYSSVNNPGGIQ